MRASGILMHISSLPSKYGIGTMGEEAYRFARFLQDAGQRYWQILPLGPTSYGDSPYQSPSTYAGNPYFIDLDLLQEDGLLTQEEIDAADFGGRPDWVDYGRLFQVRYALLYKAFQRGWRRDKEQVAAFRKENPWLKDYALFMAIKRSQNMVSWEHWPEPLRLREKEAMASARQRYREDIRFFIYLQYLFYQQWERLHSYVNSLGIQIIGDVPIYVPYDSADVWANPKLFQLDEKRTPIGVAGCPPDAFSEDGQLWGNPLYDWKAMRRNKYRWWMGRIAAVGKLVDVIRIDHFRGLESYWSVPYEAATAKAGRWIKGPGEEFIRTLQIHFPQLKLIAEDLGFLTQEVIDLQKLSGYPGMKVLEFAFDPREPGNYLPHRYETNCVCYTGTHDNETLAQWIVEAPKECIDFAMEYLEVEEKKDLHWAIIEAGMNSRADLFIAPMQDYLALGGEARMNVPSTVSTKNWSWRMKQGQLTDRLAQRLRTLTAAAKRCDGSN